MDIQRSQNTPDPSSGILKKKKKGLGTFF